MTPSTRSGITPFPPGRLDAVIVGRRLSVVRMTTDAVDYPLRAHEAVLPRDADWRREMTPEMQVEAILQTV